MIRYFVAFALLCSTVAAQDTPVDDLSVLTASKEVQGTGKKADPFIFTAETKCVLKLTGKAQGVAWDVEDCPADFEVIDSKFGLFSLASPGVYQVAVHGGNVYSKAWFEIKGPNGPPQPTNALAARLRAAMVGADAKKDAVQFAEIVRGVADAIEANPPTVHKPLKALWDGTFKSNGWPTGKYPLLPDVGRMAIPTADDTTAIDAVQLAAIVANLRTLQKTAEAIGNGK